MTQDTATELSPPRTVWTSPRAIKTWMGGLFLAIGLGLEYAAPRLNHHLFDLGGHPFAVSDVVLLITVVIAGFPVLREGAASIRHARLDMDLLVTIALLGAVAIGMFDEAAMLAFLFGVAELLEDYSLERARNSLRDLMDLSPNEATVRRDGDTHTIPVEDVRVGDEVIVRPGERIPVDGHVIEGHSAVNQAPITGESVPVDKSVDDEVFAGTITEDGYLEITADTEASETTLSKIISLIEDAEQTQTKREQFVDRFTAYYTPAVVIFALLTMSLPPLVFEAHAQTWFVRGLTLLVIACPCAFVISTPVSVVSALTSAAKHGVLIKGGDNLETMEDIGTVAFDKTGTLTKGELTVTDIIAADGYTEEDVLRRAAALERRSDHPIADAISAHVAAEGMEECIAAVSDFESRTGKGVQASLEGATWYAGKPGLFEELGAEIPLADERIAALQGEGKTLVLVGTEVAVTGALAIADEVRPEARHMVEQLHERGVTTLMLTGDNERAAAAIADHVGIDEYHAELLPEEKAEIIEDVRESEDGIAMLGDGINDAPALATADIGIAMGAAGTDTAIETADIALMSDDLETLPYLYRLSETTSGVIRGNIGASLLVKLLLALGVPLGYVTVAIAVLIGDMGMSLGVTGNAMRVARLSPGEE